ncbi:VanZ family protein [Slackia isoflavoniconvertens]|uniref:VanZ family protein n=1 Tax=Slackia isoflavoniconvertens TaxID=572010 RepID=UPI002E75F9AD|nr:VanZ family protein [Slackia isoflavoniconvertens]
MKTQSRITNKSTGIPMRKSSHAIDEPKATIGEELEGSNRPRLSRRACALLSWAAVAIVLAFIFCMSAKTGNDLDNHSGIISIVKNLLVAGATALFGREVDVSPVGHFTEYLLLGAALVNALRFTPWTIFERNATAHPAGMLGDFPSPLVALILSSLYGVSDEFHQIFTPSRSCDPMDWLVDTCAAAIGAAIVWTLLKKHSSRPR